MIKKLCVTLIFAVVALPCMAATSGSYVSLHHEQRDSNRSTGISLTSYKQGLALGISANRITSPQPLEPQNHTTNYPVYVFARMAFRLTVAPYAEFGIDLGDLMLNLLLLPPSKEQSTRDDIDVYGAIGIKTSMRRAPIDFAVYVKSYYKTQRDDDGTGITMRGANIIFNF